MSLLLPRPSLQRPNTCKTFRMLSEKVSRIPKAKKDSSGRLIFDGTLLDYLENALDPEDEKQRINIEDVRLGVEAFNACVARVGADVDAPKFIINEQAVFYETVRLCFEKLGDAFNILITGKLFEPVVRLAGCVQPYLVDL
ncbi:hypothetical protein ANCDUO_14579 [Ancylostoma duodenale]|uniref:Uncharacterized protein n=1 Tax=Ancylostoma duodenale TaxID=51022 RepID=A0A0C2CFZ1_9BILA|nr:hypothetical protein ANCDUO_14579 [Ancylostoma duodenale]